MIRRLAGFATRLATRRAASRAICALAAGAVVAMLASGAAAANDVRNYRLLIANALVDIMQIKKAPAGAYQAPAATFQAAPLRIARAPQPGDHAVCLRTVVQGRESYFAAFITQGKVETIRRAVGIDRCWLETDYAALPRATVKRKADAVPPARSSRRGLKNR